MKKLVVLIALALFMVNSNAGGKGSGIRGHHTDHSGSASSSSSSFVDYSASNFSQPKINMIQQNSNETQSLQPAINYDFVGLKCYVCKTNHTTSFQDMPCGYYAVNNIP
jgi:hypothetical protein